MRTPTRAHTGSLALSRACIYSTRDSISLRIVAAVNVYERTVGLNARKPGHRVYVKRAHTHTHTYTYMQARETAREIRGNLRRNERVSLLGT